MRCMFDFKNSSAMPVSLLATLEHASPCTTVAMMLKIVMTRVMK